VCGGAVGLDQLDDRAGEEAAISDDMMGELETIDQLRKGRLVGGLAGRE
jgi:hypothetical protein